MNEYLVIIIISQIILNAYFLFKVTRLDKHIDDILDLEWEAAQKLFNHNQFIYRITDILNKKGLVDHECND